MAKQVTAKAPSAKEAMTPARFEKELADLKNKAVAHSPLAAILSSITPYAKAVFLLFMMGVSSAVSQLALSPTFGGIPSGIHHSKVTAAACFIGSAGSSLLSHSFKTDLAPLLPVIAIWIPALQFYLGGLSSALTATWGPLVVEAATLAPLLVVSAAQVAALLEGRSVRWLPRWLGDSLPGLLAFFFYNAVEAYAAAHIPRLLGSSMVSSRVGLQMLLASSYVLFAPSKLLLLALPALVHTAMFNTHLPSAAATAMLQAALEKDKWVLVDRKESLTGYISVLESIEQGFRIMRCDHSLLGGEWSKYRQGLVAEPVYSVFVMLEAVRLVITKKPILDSSAKALVIGLGIGTTPGAFITHGIDTTIVEIDPVVHEFAEKYFDLPTNHTSVIEDAVSYTAGLAKTAPESFDYIVHDVFTGGAEPVPLFTLEFLQGLYDLLKPDGVIAIHPRSHPQNYAGDFFLPPSKAVVKTIRTIFPSCRIFREMERMTEDQVKQQNQDFSNMVIFCRKTAEPLTFRAAVAADFLGTGTRKMTLQPRFEVLDSDFKAVGETKIVMNNDTSQLAEYRDSSAVGHWTIMREVVPPTVWNQW
ncbi:hypothetical protein TD95_000954 [Thielaviopsis punctulata]|uniref:PABS domain-containing protein n=1 Tax=Thielaviopsis punctulata TaxID=72032 RepID=A0A0F4ZH63_9PEZI|nr:hypothetical protein TD95_000954 [Thielaviopsis punctulata]